MTYSFLRILWRSDSQSEIAASVWRLFQQFLSCSGQKQTTNYNLILVRSHASHALYEHHFAWRNCSTRRETTALRDPATPYFDFGTGSTGQCIHAAPGLP